MLAKALGCSWLLGQGMACSHVCRPWHGRAASAVQRIRCS